MWSMKARREVERVPKRSAEMRVSLAFSKRARGVYLVCFCCSALARVWRGCLWLARYEGAQGLRKVNSMRFLEAVKRVMSGRCLVVSLGWVSLMA